MGEIYDFFAGNRFVTIDYLTSNYKKYEQRLDTRWKGFDFILSFRHTLHVATFRVLFIYLFF